MKKWYQKLKEARIQKEWTQQDLAEQIGAQPITVSRWERGLTTPSLFYRRKLCEALGKTAQELGFFSPEIEPAEESATTLEPSDPANTPPPETEPAEEGATRPEQPDPASTPPPGGKQPGEGTPLHNRLPQSPLLWAALPLGVLVVLLGVVAMVRYVFYHPPAAPTPTAPTALLETSTRLVAFASGRLRWSFSGHFPLGSQPLVDLNDNGGIVFVLGDCNQQQDCSLHAVSLASGQKAWDWQYPSKFDFTQSIPGALAWTVGNGTLYLGIDANLYAIQVSGGKLLWTWQAPPYADRKIGFVGINSQLIPTQGGIYAVVPGGVFLLRQQDGKPMAHTDAPPWKCDPQGGVGGLLDSTNKQLIVADCNDLVGLSADQLKQTWAAQLKWQSNVLPQTALVNNQIVAWYGNTGAQFGVFVLPATGAQGPIQPTLRIGASSSLLLLDSGTGTTLLYGVDDQDRLITLNPGHQPQYSGFSPAQAQNLSQVYDLSGGGVQLLVHVITSTSPDQEEVFTFDGTNLKPPSRALPSDACPVGQVALTADGAYCASPASNGGQTALALLDPGNGSVTAGPTNFDGAFIALVLVQ